MSDFLCRFLGHTMTPYRDVHYAMVEDGVWTTTVVEEGSECSRCGEKKATTIRSIR